VPLTDRRKRPVEPEGCGAPTEIDRRRPGTEPPAQFTATKTSSRALYKSE
jgi:hypothetical protein